MQTGMKYQALASIPYKVPAVSKSQWLYSVTSVSSVLKIGTFW